jgi:hypothetical protein
MSKTAHALYAVAALCTGLAAVSPPAALGSVRASSPRPAEVRDALARVFAGAVQLSGRAEVLVLDLNGDGSADLVAVVTPLPSRLPELNADRASWLVQDPCGPVASSREGRARVQASDTLLAVVHGHGAAGWKSRDARQAYLLKDVPRGMTRRTLAEIIPKERAAASPPREVIVGDLGSAQGFLYWSGARYVWHVR